MLPPPVLTASHTRKYFRVNRLELDLMREFVPEELEEFEFEAVLKQYQEENDE